jgi:trimeric autotransporter adhesin
LAGTSVTALLLLGSPAGQANAAGPGGWDHLGDGGTAGTASLNGTVSALNVERPGTLYVGGGFTAAGGIASANRIAAWDGNAWSAVSSPTSQIAGGAVTAIAYDAASGKLFAGGTFINAGGNADADHLAVWNGNTWAPVCNAVGSPIGGTVHALEIIGRTLYVGGSFQDGAGLASADFLVACSLDTGAASSTVTDPAHPFSGPIYALTVDSSGTLYAGGAFSNLDNDQADNVAYLDSSGAGWQEMGSGAGACSCAVGTFVRSLTAVGTNVYVGTDATNVAGIAQADHVARWNGSVWSAVGSNAAGADGWFPGPATINGLANDGTNLYATGSFQDANGDPQADSVASFDGITWNAIGSDGGSNGPWSGAGHALAAFDGRLVAGGNFTSAGGDTQAQFAAVYPANVTPTVPPTTSTVPPTALPAPRTGARRCVVPKLKGRSLRVTRKKLKKARCKLGKVRGKKTKSAKVIKQSRKAGKRLAPGTKVSVKLGK